MLLLLLQVLQSLTKQLMPQSPDHSKPNWESGHGMGSSGPLALKFLLQQLEREGNFPGKSEVLCQWFKTSMAVEGVCIPSKGLSELMNTATKALRASETSLTSSGLDQLSVRLCQRAISLPPIAAIEASNKQQHMECADILTNISDAFLMSDQFGHRRPEDGGFLGASTPAERKALLAVAMKQVQGEVSAARAAAARTRVGSAGKGCQAPADRCQHLCTHLCSLFVCALASWHACLLGRMIACCNC